MVLLLLIINIVASCDSLYIPPELASDGNVVSVLQKYTKSVHNIRGYNTSLGVTLNSGMRVLFFDDAKHNPGTTSILLNVNFGSLTEIGRKMDVAHIIEHLILSNYDPLQNDCLLEWIRMHSIASKGVTKLHNTFYIFSTENRLIKDFFNKFNRVLFNLQFSDKDVEREYKLTMDEYLQTKLSKFEHQWLYNGTNFVYKPLYEQMGFSFGDFEMSEFTSKVKNMYNHYYKPNFMQLIVRGRNASSTENIVHYLGQADAALKSASALPVEHNSNSKFKIPNCFIRIILNKDRILDIVYNIKSTLFEGRTTLFKLLATALTTGTDCFVDALAFGEKLELGIFGYFSPKAILEPTVSIARQRFRNIESSPAINEAVVGFFIPNSDQVALITGHMLENVFHAIALSKLRVDSGLGYSIHHKPRCTYNGCYFLFSVRSAAHSPNEIGSKILLLFSRLPLTIFHQDLVKDVSEDLVMLNFESWKQKLRIRDIKSVRFEQIMARDYNFQSDFYNYELIIQSIGKKDSIRNMFRKYLRAGSKDMKIVSFHFHTKQPHIRQQFLKGLVEKN